jgi:WG containing repeat
MVEEGFEEYTLRAIIDKDCNIIFPFRYYDLAFGPVIDEKNPITVGLEKSHGDGGKLFKYVFMNEKQEQVIATDFDEASSFFKGVARVSKDGKSYCIKNDGVLLDYCDECNCYR